jgi:hypothetical protein
VKRQKFRPVANWWHFGTKRRWLVGAGIVPLRYLLRGLPSL